MKALALACAALLAAGTASAQERLRGDALQEQPVFGYGAPNDTVSTPAEPPLAGDQQTAEIPDEQKLAYPSDKREPSLAKELTDMVRQRNRQEPAK